MKRKKLKEYKVKEPDFRKVIDACVEYIEFLNDPLYSEDRLSEHEHAIFEAAMIATYGEDIFDKIDYDS